MAIMRAPKQGLSLVWNLSLGRRNPPVVWAVACCERVEVLATPPPERNCRCTVAEHDRDRTSMSYQSRPSCNQLEPLWGG